MVQCRIYYDQFPTSYGILHIPFSVYFPPLLLVFAILCLSISLWVFRDRINSLFGHSEFLVESYVGESEVRSGLRFAQRIGRSFRRMHQGTRLTQDAIQDAIFAQYRMLLRFLSAKGVVVKPTDTHIDLQHRMVHQGFQVEAVNFVTVTFEQAMYSPRPVSYEQLLQYDQNVFRLLTGSEG